MLIGAPLSGWLALLFHERHGALWREVGAYLTLRLRPRQAEALRALRREIRQEIEALVVEQQTGEDQGLSPRSRTPSA